MKFTYFVSAAVALVMVNLPAVLANDKSVLWCKVNSTRCSANLRALQICAGSIRWMDIEKCPAGCLESYGCLDFLYPLEPPSN